MSLEEKIILNVDHPMAKLFLKAKKAAEQPKTGIKIINPYAEFVIRDCAKITTLYLPIFLYGSCVDPLATFKKKFTANEIIELVNRSKDDIPTRQLLKLMMMTTQKYIIDQTIKNANLVKAHETVKQNTKDDVYGDYGDDAETAELEIQETQYVDLSTLSEKEIAKKLIEAFEAT